MTIPEFKGYREGQVKVCKVEQGQARESLREKLYRRQFLNPEDTSGKKLIHIHINFLYIDSSIDRNGNRVNSIIVLLAMPSGAIIDITYLMGKIFNLRVTKGGVIKGHEDEHTLRRMLFNEYGNELGMDLADFWILRP